MNRTFDQLSQKIFRAKVKKIVMEVIEVSAGNCPVYVWQIKISKNKKRIIIWQKYFRYSNHILTASAHYAEIEGRQTQKNLILNLKKTISIHMYSKFVLLIAIKYFLISSALRKFLQRTETTLPLLFLSLRTMLQLEGQTMASLTLGLKYVSVRKYESIRINFIQSRSYVSVFQARSLVRFCKSAESILLCEKNQLFSFALLRDNFDIYVLLVT